MDIIISWIPEFISFAIFAFYGYCQYVLSKKFDMTHSWMAFVPILNLVNLIKISGGKWYEIFITLFPIVNLYWMIRYVLHNISKRTGHGAGWTFGLAIFPIIFFPITTFSLDNVIAEKNKLWNSSRNGKGVWIIGIFFGLLIPILWVISNIAYEGYKNDAQAIAQRMQLEMVSSAILNYAQIGGKGTPPTPLSECAMEIKELDLSEFEEFYTGGAGKCSNGYAYKTLKTKDGGLTYILAMRVSKQSTANFDGSNWGQLNSYDQLQKILSDTQSRVTSTNPQDWYYIETPF